MALAVDACDPALSVNKKPRVIHQPLAIQLMNRAGDIGMIFFRPLAKGVDIGIAPIKVVGISVIVTDGGTRLKHVFGQNDHIGVLSLSHKIDRGKRVTHRLFVAAVPYRPRLLDHKAGKRHDPCHTALIFARIAKLHILHGKASLSLGGDQHLNVDCGRTCGRNRAPPLQKVALGKLTAVGIIEYIK